MSALTQAALVSGGIFTVVMLSQYGRRAYKSRDLLRPLLMTAAVAFFYLRGMPFSAADVSAYLVAVALGLVFGGAATLATGVERDAAGRVFTRCGPVFAGIWGAAVVLRLGFIWTVENVGWAHDHFGRFMYDHQISLDAIAPFFVIWALTMVVSRIAVVASRVAHLQAGAPRERVLV